MIRYFLALLALAVTSSQAQTVTPAQSLHGSVRVIYFFGTEGMNVEKARSVLPVHLGDELSSDLWPETEKEIRRALKNASGPEPTDVEILWGNGPAMIFIGLGGANSHFRTIAAPTGNTCPLSEKAMRNLDDAWNDAVRAQRWANSPEDDFRGSAPNYADVRSRQRDVRQYVVHHERSIERVLLFCGNVKQRRAAAGLLRYSSKSKRQIAALVHAGHDPDVEVRINAVRSLVVLARSGSETASEIPAQGLIDLLNSGLYDDRIEAGLLLEVLTSTRDPELLRRLRSECLPSLIEMARWELPFGRPSLAMLGRIAGIDEARIDQLIENEKGHDLITAVGNMH